MTGFKSKRAMSVARQSGKSHFSAVALKRLMDDMLNRPIEDLILSEGQVYGNRYYTAEPVGGNWRAMEDWMIENMGSSTGSIWAGELYKEAPRPNERWYSNDRKFWFRDEQDRIVFILRWRCH